MPHDYEMDDTPPDGMTVWTEAQKEIARTCVSVLIVLFALVLVVVSSAGCDDGGYPIGVPLQPPVTVEVPPAVVVDPPPGDNNQNTNDITININITPPGAAGGGTQ